jgi:hypothetical protein
MNAFIFVSVVCIGQSCNFVTSSKPVDEAKCKQMKAQFLSLPFKKEITLAATQCLEFEGDNNSAWKVKI